MTITEALNVPKCMNFTKYEKLLEEKKNLEKQRMGKGCVSVSCICQEEEDREE